MNLNRDIRALGTTVTVRVYTESYNDRGDLNTSSYTDYTTVAYIDIYAGDTIYSPEGEVITADAFGYFQTDAGNYLNEGVEVIHNNVTYKVTKVIPQIYRDRTICYLAALRKV